MKILKGVQSDPLFSKWDVREMLLAMRNIFW